jgi:hypothetical protein
MTEQRYGSSVIAQTDSPKAGKGKATAKATSAALVEANPARVSLYVCNPSDKEVWLALGSEAKKEEGIWLKREGGTAYIPDYSGVVACVTTEGEGTITYAEV